jgi:molybdopterin synthase catalytic subunit
MGNHFLHVADRATEALDPAAALEFVSDPGFGGITMFVGRVRDLNHGRAVAGISYDLYQPLALARFAEIAEQAQREVGPALRLYIAHAKGRLAVGEFAVVIAAGTPHRDEAFHACRLVIEAVKHTTPIWKQEHYVEGDSQWSEGCSLCDAPAVQGAQEHDHVHDHGHERPRRP